NSNGTSASLGTHRPSAVDAKASTNEALQHRLPTGRCGRCDRIISRLFVILLGLFEGIVHAQGELARMDLPHLRESLTEAGFKERPRLLFAASVPVTSGDQFLLFRRDQRREKRRKLRRKGSPQPAIEEVAEVCIPDVVVIGRVSRDDLGTAPDRRLP